MKEKSGIPKNPGRHDLGMRATMLFPDREIVERSYVPIIYTACRTCYSELPPEEIYRRAVAGEIDPTKQSELVNRVIESVCPKQYHLLILLFKMYQKRVLFFKHPKDLHLMQVIDHHLFFTA